MVNLWFVALGAGLLVVILLAAYAARLWWRVWRQSRASTRRHAASREDQAHSMHVLARLVLDDELNLTEGAIRLKVLLDHWLPAGEGQQAYPAIYRLHDATAHMPRRLERRQWPRAEIERLDAEREVLESQHREQVLAEADRLLSRLG